MSPRELTTKRELIIGGIAFLLLLIFIGISLSGEPLAEEVKTIEPPCTVSTAAVHTITRVPNIPVARDEIVSDGNLLPYEMQLAMQYHCKKYGVPYALALAVAEVESNFRFIESATNDYGYMQINEVNFSSLLNKGINPLSEEGNIEAGVYLLSKAINRYGDYELALMSYNRGDGGARKLWNKGVVSNTYSAKVMHLFEKWKGIVGDRI